MSGWIGRGSLSELLAGPIAAADDCSWGWVESVAWSGFVRLIDGELKKHDGALVDLSTAYDVRLFGLKAEWHWWWPQTDPIGRWALLSDESARDHDWVALAGSDAWPSQRLLRGSVKQVQDGWARLHDGHSAHLWVPLVPAGTKSGDRLAIRAIEYGAVDSYGNVSVVAERLTELTRLETR
ncbi:MAG: hypothetical protein LBM94_04390 [Propionibacteriaceae bacterium]|jgi:CRISPR-associated protein (TIGR03984 family)|nr:hypothetical protein [Propionibacteriaceae bacterium]